ncbi:surface lipoprotein assembly modifier [Avibacterium sp. 20-126]|uniref:surface lipoprotein assembly modifier n=1 Tax=Avibacterium sp. 20-126 TaxID=2911524 RepID=UPI00218C68A8|nr:surface lipoprotein assembly modifier [Avibacterium sp. 20-126]
MKNYFLILLGVAFLRALPSYANENTEQGLQLWQNSQQKINQQQKEAALFPFPNNQKENEITLDGQSFSVANTEADVGQALYIAVNQQLWHYAEKFLQQYRQFPQHRKELVWFAQGALARQRGELIKAEAEYQKLLESEPTFLRGQLDLARILFENKKNKEASKLFSQLVQMPLPNEVNALLKEYLQVLKEREQWHGELRVGYRYQKNINQSPEHYRCLLFSGSTCIVQRATPKVINAKGWGYELNLNRHFNLIGNHGINIYFNSEGQYYPMAQEYNDTTFKTHIGYTFQDAKRELIISPLFEYELFANKRYYHAFGGHLGWMQSLLKKHFLNVQLEYKHLSYNSNYSAVENAGISSLYTTWYYTPHYNTTLFIGGDGKYRNVTDKTNAYKMLGTRFGLYHQFNEKLNLTLLASIKRTNYLRYNAILETKRKDNQLIYQAILAFPNIFYEKLTPNLIIKRTINRSNVDWLYSYKQTELQFNLHFIF